MDAVEVVGLTKIIEGKAVLEDASLVVRRGEVFGILGPNGAGKSTLLNCMFGLWSSAAGSVRTLGLDPRRDGEALRRRAYFLPVQPYADARRPGRAHLALIADLYGLAPALAKRQIEGLAVAFGLERVLDDTVDGYSAGQYKKLCLAGALVSNAELLILDEPFTGEVDPAGVATLRVLLARLARERGTTCIVTTQIVAFARDLFDRVAIVNGGRIVACGTIAQVAAQFGHEPADLESVVQELTGKQTIAAGLDFVDAVPVRGGEAL
jgi:ABC-2 type transport system ATP-binding protein